MKIQKDNIALDIVIFTFYTFWYIVRSRQNYFKKTI